MVEIVPGVIAASFYAPGPYGYRLRPSGDGIKTIDSSRRGRATVFEFMLSNTAGNKRLTLSTADIYISQRPQQPKFCLPVDKRLSKKELKVG